MLHFIFDFILKSQPSRPSPLMPFTKTTGPEGIYSLKARPWLLTPSLFIYTQPRTSQCIPEMALVTLAIGNLRLITLPQVKKYQSRFLRCFYFFSRMTPAGFHHSRGIYASGSLSTLMENSGGVFNRDCLFPNFNLITVHTCNLFLLLYIITWL